MIESTRETLPAKQSRRTAGLVLLGIGAVLALFAIAYTIFAMVSRSRSDELVATLPPDDRGGFSAPTPVSTVSDPESLVPRFASLYPGSQVNPRYWDDPRWAGIEPFAGPDLPEGYEPTLRPGFGLRPGTSSPAMRIRIPAIGLDEVVEELQLVVDESGTRYEQPVNIVGHIIGTPDPGENGAGWYFGHQSNFGSSEGAVFERLPDVFDLFRNDPVYVYLDTENDSFAYRVIGTDVEDRETLTIVPTDTATVTLVTSWPPLVFDQRFLVFAELVGMKRG